MIQPIYRAMIELTNGRFTSALLKRFARSKASKAIVPSFAKAFQINQDEMEKGIEDYPTLHEFFVRNLKEGSRTHDPRPLSVASPVDAVIEDTGTILPEKQIEVKGKIYSMEEMLGNSEILEKYIGGSYMIFYLSPTHYHRIHSPISAAITKQWSLGRKSYPVNKLGLKFGRSPLSKNYRMISELKHAGGHIALVKVGAMFVNSIETVHKGSELKKGEEMAYFTFGSTVVLLFERGTFEILPAIKTPAHIKVGEAIGFVKEKGAEQRR